METIIDGRPVRLLGTREAPGAIIDTWMALDEAADSVDRTGVVVTVRGGQEIAAEPFHGWAGNYGFAVVSAPADDAVARFQVALRQAHRRYEERMSDGQFSQVWPPPGAPSLVGVVTEGDTRDGWLRITWLPDGTVTVQGPAEWTRLVPADRSWASVLRWAQGAGFASIFPANAP